MKKVLIILCMLCFALPDVWAQLQLPTADKVDTVEVKKALARAGEFDGATFTKADTIRAVRRKIRLRPLGGMDLTWFSADNLAHNLSEIQMSALELMAKSPDAAPAGGVLWPQKFLYNGNDALTPSVSVKRWIGKANITVPTFLIGVKAGAKDVSVRANPLVGIGTTFYREEVSIDDDKKISKDHFLAAQVMVLVYRNKAGDDDFGFAPGVGLTFWNDRIQVGYAYSLGSNPFFQGRNLWMAGTNIPLNKLFGSGDNASKGQ